MPDLEQPVENPCSIQDESNDPILKDTLIEALKTIFDPEIPVNIYELGLIYALAISPERDVTVQMTLTTPACPVAQTFPSTVESTLLQIPNVNSATVVLVWDPPWNQNMISEAGRMKLGMI